MDHAKLPTSNPHNGAPSGAPITSLRPFDHWLKELGKSRATGWRWRVNGLVETCNILGRHYISDEEIARFERRARAGEFARELTTPVRHS
jgi:hypothetical protein